MPLVARRQQIKYPISRIKSIISKGCIWAWGVPADVAALRAEGAVVGQMLGYAATEAGNDYADAAQEFLRDATDGIAYYGSSLLDYYLI